MWSDLRSDVRHAMKIARETENSSDDMTRVWRTGNEKYIAPRSMTRRYEQRIPNFDLDLTPRWQTTDP